jgi:hypothetical protein
MEKVVGTGEKKWNVRSVCFVLLILIFEVITIILFVFILKRRIKCEEDHYEYNLELFHHQMWINT